MFEDSSLRDSLMAGLSVILSLLVVLAFVALGWYIVWKCFLSRFKFVREMLESGREPSPEAAALRRVRERTTRRVRRD